MPISTYRTPGVYVQEVPAGPRPIQAVGTSTAAFIGAAQLDDAYKNEPRAVNNWSEFVARFMPEEEKARKSTVLSNAVYGFFENGGSRCFIVNTGEEGDVDDALAAAAIEDEIAIVAAPGRFDPASHAALQSHCERLEDRVAILDTPEEVDDIGLLTQVETVPSPAGGGGGGGGAGGGASARGGRKSRAAGEGPKKGGLLPAQSDRGFTRVLLPGHHDVLDPINGELVDVPPSGHVAGIWARNRRDPRRPQGPGQRDRPRRAQRHAAADASRSRACSTRPASTASATSPREGIRVWGARTLRRRGQRVALPQRPPAVQHDRGVDRRGDALDRLRAERPRRCGSRSGATSAPS